MLILLTLGLAIAGFVQRHKGETAKAQQLFIASLVCFCIAMLVNFIAGNV